MWAYSIFAARAYVCVLSNFVRVYRSFVDLCAVFSSATLCTWNPSRVQLARHVEQRQHSPAMTKASHYVRYKGSCCTFIWLNSVRDL